MQVLRVTVVLLSLSALSLTQSASVDASSASSQGSVLRELGVTLHRHSTHFLPALPAWLDQAHIPSQEEPGRPDSRNAADSKSQAHGADARANGFPETPRHKRLFPLSAADFLGYVIAMAVIFIAAGGGIGGGGVLVPLYIMCWHFHAEHAVALSNLTITGGAFGNAVCNIRRRHPSADRPLIDWDLILVMEPMTILGAVFGGFATKMLPGWATTWLLFLLLIVLSERMWRKALNVFQQETALSNAPSRASLAHSQGHELESQQELSEHSEPLLGASWQSQNKDLVDTIMRGETQANGVSADKYSAARDILRKEQRLVPWDIFGTLVGLFGWLLITGIAKDTVKCGGTVYWLLVLSVVPLVAAVMCIVRNRLLRKGALKREVGLAPEAGDIIWTSRTTLTYPAMCSFAGVVAGMFGVGGGIVKAPLMLHLGLLPDVAAATSATMILFTSGSASVVYMTFGGVQWDYAALMMVTGFLVTFAGQQLVYYVIRAFGRRSIVVLAMAALLSLGALVMANEAVVTFWRAYKGHNIWHHDTLCGDERF